MPRPGPLRSFPLIFLIFCSLFPAVARSQDEVSLYDYALTDLEGKQTSLAPYKGKILVVEFFATWCPPCRKDLPAVALLQDNYPPDRVVFVGVSADGVSNTVHKLPAFIQEVGLKLPVLVGGAILMDKYAGVETRSGREISLPQTYIFSGEGEIEMRLVGEQKAKKKILTEELDRLLREKTPREGAP